MEVGVGQVGDLAPARSALYEALLYKERLVDLLDSAGVLSEGGGDGGEAYGASLEFVDDAEQDAVVYLVGRC